MIKILAAPAYHPKKEELAFEQSAGLAGLLNILYAFAAYERNAENQDNYLLSKDVVKKMSVWNDAASNFLKEHGVPYGALNRAVGFVATDHSVESYEKVKRNIDALSLVIKQRGLKALENDQVQVPNLHLKVIKSLVNWLTPARSERSQTSWNNINKAMGVMAVDSSIIWSLHDGDTDESHTPTSQADLVKRINEIVKVFTGRPGNALTIDQAIAAKAKNEKLFEEYRVARKQALDIFRLALRNTVRSLGGGQQDFNKVAKALSDLTIHQLPLGFVGNITEDGHLFTKGGKELEVVVKYPVKMNPAYDESIDNGFILSYDQDNGVTRYVSTKDRRVQKDKSKWDVVQRIMSKERVLVSKWRKDLLSSKKIGPKQILAAMVELCYQTAIRIGSPSGETKGQRTFGLSVLQVRHTKVDGNKFIIQFVAKDGVPHKDVLSPSIPAVARLIEILKSLRQGKDAQDMVFEKDGMWYNSRLVNKYWKSIAGSDAHIHNIRHLRGTSLAMKKLDACPLKPGANAKEAADWLNKALLEVGTLLGHVRTVKGQQTFTAKTAIKHYIDPSLIEEYYARLNLRLPNDLEKLVRKDL